VAGWVKNAANKVLSRRLERKRLKRETLALKGDSHEDRPWRLSDQHQTLLRLMLEEPTPKVSAAFKEQLAAYVKGDSHECVPDLGFMFSRRRADCFVGPWL
jgi:hypothetical protein